LSLLPKLLPVYVEILTELAAAGAEWIQIDEPALAVDLPQAWLDAYQDVYATLSQVNAKILLSTYFGSVAAHAGRLKALPVAGLHIDLVRAPEQLDAFADY
ncbi:5-methyltetrahydropteroyltriglutamate--homocysteine S-methyltransferase, partial [Enterobacter hormaechei subsp. steigerwaltii]|nr:5-methyltetrahydropteroyltriglutamate--homocysteine S-methyltransferase [Enterobacter hormaechei subsp. steigerwaltii]